MGAAHLRLGLSAQLRRLLLGPLLLLLLGPLRRRVLGCARRGRVLLPWGRLVVRLLPERRLLVGLRSRAPPSELPCCLPPEQ